MKGAKPKQDAIRRGITDAYGLAKAESVGISMPEDVANDPVQSEIWAWLVPPANNFSTQDIPQLKELVFWHAVYAQAQQALQSENGTIHIFDKIGNKPFKTPDGRDIPLVRKNPAIAILKDASAEIRMLSDQLGLSPLARSRIGLMDAVKVKSAADTAAMFKSIDAAYGLPEPEELEVVEED